MMYRAYKNIHQYLNDLDRFAEEIRESIEFLKRKKSFEGYCSICSAITPFQSPCLENANPDEWVNLRECFTCSKCGFIARHRLYYDVLMSYASEEIQDSKILLFEHVTPFAKMMANRYSSVVTCEFLSPEYKSGTAHDVNGDSILHQDMQAMSFPDSSFDILLHSDVLEHVPDYRKGLEECRRVLKPEGLLCFACPLYDVYRTKVRAEMIDGKLVHHMQPEYHGNPLTPEGSLAFVSLGWDMVNTLQDLEFSDINMNVMFSPFKGYVGDANPCSEFRMGPLVVTARA